MAKKKTIANYDYILFKEFEGKTWYVDELIQDDCTMTLIKKDAGRLTFAKATSVNKQIFSNNMDIERLNK